MLRETYGEEYKLAALKATVAGQAGTALGLTAVEILGMVTCYADDGMVFFNRGDLVNAVASCAYGYGWLDAGCMLGFVNGTMSGSPENVTGEMPEPLREHLDEKTHRYKRMLTEALSSVVILPDTETPMYQAAAKIQNTANDEFNRAKVILSDGDEVGALTHFSYGYGVLDCGVRSGLFGITGDRHPFTI